MAMDHSISSVKDTIKPILELDLSLVSPHHLNIISSAIDSLISQTSSSTCNKLKDDLQNLKAHVNSCYSSYHEIGPQIVSLSDKFENYMSDNRLYQELHQNASKRQEELTKSSESISRAQRMLNMHKREIEKYEAELLKFTSGKESLQLQYDEDEEKMKVLEDSIKRRRKEAMSWITQRGSLYGQKDS
ncbi:hypothetical protein M5689_003136 [Euphorbia peplus]|nr:hypothetical protein M5689_003136 [Euphorbia peplus]